MNNIISVWKIYSLQNFVSSLSDPKTLPALDFIECKNIQSGLYRRLAKKHFQNYNSKGQITESISSGDMLDVQA